MRSELVIIVGAVLVGFSVLLLVILFFVEREHKKQLREEVDKARTDWAKAFDAADALHLRQANTYLMVIDAKDEIIAEKDKRIEQLESQIALNQMVMACAKIDGSIDIEKLKEKIGPLTCEELAYNE